MLLLNDTFVTKTKSYPFTRRMVWKTDIVSYDSNLEQRNEIWSLPIRLWGIQYKHLSDTQRDKLFEAFNAGRGMARSLYFQDDEDYESTSPSWTQADLPITAVDLLEKYFKCAGQHANKFAVGWAFKVTGSTGNDGIYTVHRVSQTNTHTYLYVDEAIPSDVANGNILRMYFLLYKTYYGGESYTWDDPKQDIQPGQCVVKVDSVTKTEGVDYTLSDIDGIIRFIDGHVPTDSQVVTATFQFYYRVRLIEDEFDISNINYKFHEVDMIWLREVRRYSIEA